jgi:hypothetical protein
MINFSIEDAIQMLSKTPGMLTHWLSDLPVTWLMVDEGKNTFSPFEVVGHLIHGE